jgi:hypothetical protein
MAPHVERPKSLDPKSLSLRFEPLENLNWLVFDDGCLVAGFVYRDDAEHFIEQCGSDSMKLSRTTATARNGISSVRRKKRTGASDSIRNENPCGPRLAERCSNTDDWPLNINADALQMNEVDLIVETAMERS